MFPNRKTTKNSTRVSSGKKQGGQKGHAGHRRKKLEGVSTEVVDVEVPEKFLDPRHYEQLEGEYETRQLQDFVFIPIVYEYRAQKFKNLWNGAIESPKFPEEVPNDVNFSGRLKALAFLLVNRYNVSIGRTRAFLKEISGGKLDISTGCICNLSKQFSAKTDAERKEIFKQIAAAEVAHADFTFARMCGKLGTILITAVPGGPVLFLARGKKGLEAIRGSPLEIFDGVLVNDHEVTFVAHCGKEHQECLQHILRKLKEISEREHMLTWPKKMIRWIKRAIHYRNQVLRGETAPSVAKAAAFLNTFKLIVAQAGKEYGQYEIGRPLKGYREGINLYKRLSNDSDSYTRFLTDLRVPPTNNEVERYARIVKRKGHQVMCFRSFEGLEYYCDAQTVIQAIVREEKDLFEEIANIFNRPARKQNSRKGKKKADSEKNEPESETSQSLPESDLPEVS